MNNFVISIRGAIKNFTIFESGLKKPKKPLSEVDAPHGRQRFLHFIRLLKSLLRPLQVEWSKKQVVLRYALNPGSPSHRQTRSNDGVERFLIRADEHGSVHISVRQKRREPISHRKVPVNSCESLCSNVAKIVHRGRRVAM